MKRNLACLAVVIPLLSGCNGAIVGNLIVLGVTVGIFMATLSLGKSSAESTRSDAGSSQSSS